MLHSWILIRGGGGMNSEGHVEGAVVPSIDDSVMPGPVAKYYPRPVST